MSNINMSIAACLRQHEKSLLRGKRSPYKGLREIRGRRRREGASEDISMSPGSLRVAASMFYEKKIPARPPLLPKSSPEPLDDPLRLGILVRNVDRDQEMQRENNVGGQILNTISRTRVTQRFAWIRSHGDITQSVTEASKIVAVMPWTSL